MRVRIPVLLFLLIAGCSSPRQDAPRQTIPPEGVTVEMREGGELLFGGHHGGGPTLKFVRKTAESRCPTGVQCIRMGEAAIAVSFTREQGSEATFSLEIPAPPLDTLGYRFTLEALTPYPSADQPVPEPPALATIRIERARP